MKALVIDDISINRDILSDLIEDEFDVLEASNGIEALKQMEMHLREIEVVFLDLMMPEMDGFAVLEEMKKRGWTNMIPVLVVTGDESNQVEKRCLEYGISDFIRKPFNEATVKVRSRNAVNLFRLKNNLEAQVAHQTKELQKQYNALKRLNEDIIDLLGGVVESRNQESGLHVYRVKGFSEIIAADIMEHYPEYGLDTHAVEMISIASVLHDVGKIMISDSILLKPGKLTDEEFSIMRRHSEYGVEVLSRARTIWNSEYRKYCEEICHYHHERYDGRGYPKGLVGDEIPISAQIVSLADVFDALTCDRVYRKALSYDEACEMIETGKCGAFSEKILESMKRCRQPMEELSTLLKSKETDGQAI